MSDTSHITSQLNEALSLVSDVLSEAQRDDILMYIDAREWGIALETLSEFLYEDNLPLPARAYSIFQELGTSMHLDNNTWEILKPQVVD